MKAPSNIVPCRNIHLQYLCERMRPDEIENFLALTGAKTYNADVAALGLMASAGVKMTLLGADGFPIVCGGYDEPVRGVATVWMIGSLDGWAAHWRSITKAARWFCGELFAGGMRRVEVCSITSRTCATDWYERMGFVCEGVRRKLGANGEDVGIYAKVAS